jgi:hypothetical protein
MQSTSKISASVASKARVVSVAKSMPSVHEEKPNEATTETPPKPTGQAITPPQTFPPTEKFPSPLLTKSLCQPPQANLKGKIFEQEVAFELERLRDTAKVSIEAQPRIILQNDEVVIPDFHLTVELAHERRHYLIECRDRNHNSKEVLHKIRHMRDKQRWQTFLVLYPDQISPALARALDAEGIMHLNLEGLRLFVRRLWLELVVVRQVLPDFLPQQDLDKPKQVGTRLTPDRRW